MKGGIVVGQEMISLGCLYVRGGGTKKREAVEHCKRTGRLVSFFFLCPFLFFLFMFENKFFPRRLRQKSEEAISKRITRFFQPRQQQGGEQQQHWMNYDDDSKLEIPDTVIIGEDGCWLPSNHHHDDGEDEAMLYSSSTAPDLSTCASHTTDDDDLYYDDDSSSRKMIMQFSSNEEYQSQQQQQQQLSLAEHVRLVLADAFDVADEQFERERCILSPTTL